MSQTPKISVCIPSYECKGNGVRFIEQNITSILNQTYKNFEIVVSDHSKDDEIENFILNLDNPKIKYYRYNEKIGFPAFNTNNAIKNSSGDYIKLMNLDDYIESSDTLEMLVEIINKGFSWVLSGFKHLNYNTNIFYNPMIPKIVGNGTHLIYGQNFVGCPSVALIPKEEYFDTNVMYMIDCELWYRLYIKYGNPGILENHKIVVGHGDHQLTSQWESKKNEMLQQDINYCKSKFKV